MRLCRGSVAINRCGCAAWDLRWLRDAASPPDVRRGCAPPLEIRIALGLCPRFGLRPRLTSGGRAVASLSVEGIVVSRSLEGIVVSRSAEGVR